MRPRPHGEAVHDSRLHVSRGAGRRARGGIREPGRGPGTSGATRSSTRPSTSRCSRPSTSTSTSTPRSAQAVQQAAQMAERWYARLSRVLGPRAARPAAADPLRQPSRLRADQRHPGRAWRGDGWRHRDAQAADRPAARDLARRERPRDRPRAGSRVPVRHHAPARQTGRDGRCASAPAVVHRGHGGVPVDRAGRPAHGDVDARRRLAGEDPEREGPRRSRGTSRIAGARRSGPT